MSKSKKISSNLSSTTVKNVVTFYLYFYLILAVLTLIAMGMTFLQHSFSAGYILPFLIAGFIAFGISQKYSWIPLIIILFAAIGLISNLFTPSSTVFWILSMLFLIIEILVFSNKNVKNYFSNKK